MSILRVGIAGLGTVGAGVFRILSDHPSFKVTAVSARDKSKDRGLNLSGVTFVDNPIDLATRTDVDAVVEVMGGDGDPALSLVKTALQNKKAVVTANKALLAYHGAELAQIAEENKTPLLYEAAVAGGIPIIKMLREGLAANEIEAVYGILNGTCNYILTTMEQTGQDFAGVLDEAQKLGYAEADPSLDVDGGDTGHKLSILTALTFGCKPDFQSLSVGGIRAISAEDIRVADELGYRIKLISQARKQKSGAILQMVSPSLLPKSSPMANVSGVLNGILTEGNHVGQSFVAGRGAGSGPTASAVVADLIDLSRGQNILPFGKPVATLSDAPKTSFADWEGAFYIRLVVKDQTGVIADVSPILRDANISIESLIQRGRSTEQPVSIIIMTHDTTGQNILDAVQKIKKLDCSVAEPLVMPVLKI
ncbi:MAG: homoserine dehydrogenase [Alphaproteobacteria bacterium RIFCSPHIGHO2_12_FULL_45_9]|nr:MAG: homoserine dehydrogenase [Alphaproteobacteria bacterium RIFCSPHIGHO2_12_FULL_45_9]